MKRTLPCRAIMPSPMIGCRDAFYQEINGQSRKAMHQRVGLLLEEKYRDDEDTIIFDLYAHFIESEDEERVEKYGFASGMKAMKEYAL